MAHIAIKRPAFSLDERKVGAWIGGKRGELLQNKVKPKHLKGPQKEPLVRTKTSGGASEGFDDIDHRPQLPQGVEMWAL
jgi:hypothetical protein